MLWYDKVRSVLLDVADLVGLVAVLFVMAVGAFMSVIKAARELRDFWRGDSEDGPTSDT
ncbi:hypothetical protein [Streptomyces canarius]|uniref:Uncharacterized protein n=1 Tax=Streptomyces canarius TaxID=285453 RepID=A0ABQ3CYH6_9ACTN|nr:hypothetical protein GCM10010345_54140 [Streptomyces canarius]